MRTTSTKLILTACQMAFEGKTHEEIAEALDTHASAITRWRKNPLWAEFESELIKAHKQSLINAHVAEPLSEG